MDILANINRIFNKYTSQRKKNAELNLEIKLTKITGQINNMSYHRNITTQ